MRPKWHFTWRLTALTFDATALVSALGGAAALRYGLHGAANLAKPEQASLYAPWLLATPIWLGALALFGLYNPTRWANAVEEGRRLIAACCAAPTALVLISFLFHTSPSRLWVGLGTVSAIGAVGLGRRGLRKIAGRLRRRGAWVSRAVVVGGRDAKILVDGLLTDVEAGTEPVATCGFVWGELPSYEADKLAIAVIECRANAVAIVSQDLEREDVQRAIAVADQYAVSVFVLPGVDFTLMHNVQLVPVGREPALAIEAPSLRVYQRVVKRAFDLAVSLSAIVVLSPLLAVAAALIKVDSKGSIFYRHRRTGLGGEEFEVFKFRTMVDGAHGMREGVATQNGADGPLFKIKGDPRLTRVGHHLRRWSIDEVPQLWNVVRGEMSIVGPRPALPEEVANYTGSIGRRLTVRPGLTGLWQVSGRSDLPFEDYVRLDLTYVKSWSFLLDLYLLARTLPAVVSGRGAY